MENIILEKVGVKDWEKVLFFEKSCTCYVYHSIVKEEELKDYIRDNEVYFIILEDKKVGTISYECKDNVAHFNGLTVLPEYRGRGIATFVMKKILSELKEFNEASLDVHPENSSAIVVYLKSGFVIKKWNANLFGESEHRLFLVKNLN